MKHLLILLFFISIHTGLCAQSSAVTNAILYHKDGELVKAKEEIDLATLNEKTKEMPKTWYYKGLIYLDLSNSKNEAYKAASAKSLEESYGAFAKAMELDKGEGEYHKLSKARMNELWVAFINQGYNEYEASTYDKAITNFEFAQKIKPSDTTAYIYGLYAADELKKYDLIKSYSEALARINYKSPYIYKNQIYIAGKIDKDKEKAMSLANQALTDFPGHPALVEEQTNLYIESGQYDKAIQNLEAMLVKNPMEINLLTRQAVLYDQVKNTSRAVEIYEKIVSLEPENFIANFNSAVIYYDKGRTMNEDLHNLTVADYQKNGKKMEEEVNALFNRSLAHAQTALKSVKDPTDQEHLNIIISELNKVLKKK